MRILYDGGAGSLLGGGGAGGGGGQGGGSGGGGAGGGNGGDWRASLPQELRDEPSLKTIADIPALAKGYVHSQKLVGADKVAKPQANWTDAQYEEFYNQVGRPGTLDGYKVPDDLKLEDGQTWDEKKLNSAREMFHKAGLTTKQAGRVLRYYTDTLNGATRAERASHEQMVATETAKLKADFGLDYDANLDMARAALRRFGSSELVEFLNTSGLGNNAHLVRAFHKIGSLIAEDRGRGEGNGLFVKDTTAAVQEINRLVADKEFQEALNSRSNPGHAAAVERWMHLHSVAYPGKVAE